MLPRCTPYLTDIRNGRLLQGLKATLGTQFQVRGSSLSEGRLANFRRARSDNATELDTVILGPSAIIVMMLQSLHSYPHVAG